jgi:FHA domain
LAQGKQSLNEELGRPRLGGNIVVSELIRNMELGRFEMAYAVLLPCIFTVYLNPTDYAMLSGVLDLVIEDARKALRARVIALNEAAPSAFGARRRNGITKEHKIACGEWDIEFLSDAEVPPGDVEIHSELNEAPAAGLRGTKTTLIGREPSATQRTAERRNSSSGQHVYAAIHYEDESGPQIYLVTQNQVRVGRGSEEQPADLALRMTDEISREHVVIRRDPATGVFSILDASTNGTWLNGKRLRKGVEDVLPGKARIGLGEVIDLAFEVRG